MNPFTLFTLSGPIIGAIAWFSATQWLLWVGVALAVVNLALNLASGAMKAPVLPLVAVVATAVAVHPWYLGAGLGLLAYTAIEGLGELFRRPE